MTDVNTFINSKFKNLPKTKNVLNVKEELLDHLQDKVDQLILEGYSKGEANQKVIHDFGDFNEIIDAYGIKDEKANLSIHLTKHIFLLLANFLSILYLIFHLFTRHKPMKIQIFINLFEPNTILNSDLPIWDIILLFVFLIGSWLIYFFYKDKGKIYSFILISLGIFIIVFNSYLIGLLYLLCGLIGTIEYSKLYIKISIILNILFFIPVIVILFLDITSGKPFSPFYPQLYYFSVFYITMYILLIFSSKKESSFLTISFYLVICVHFIQYSQDRWNLLFIGFPITVLFTLLKFNSMVKNRA